MYDIFKEAEEVAALRLRLQKTCISNSGTGPKR